MNTYATGVTTISGGTLSVSNLVNGGANSNIGATTNAAGNLVINGGTLRYTGATASTNRNFTLGTSGGTLDASGTGVLTITGAPTMSGTNTARTLTLTGDNTGTNTLQGIIGNNGTGLTSVTKSGTGTWVLSGANTYSGETRISEGTLVFSTGSLPTTSSIVMDGGTLRWTNTLDFSAKIALTAGKTANLDTAGNNIALATALGSAAPTSGLYKTGTGTLTLNGINNSYSGNTTINQGTFALGAVATLANSAIITVGDTVDSTAEFNVSSKAGGFDLAATQTLKGSGLVIGNVNVTGVLAPGNSIESLAVTGNLNLNDSSSLQLEIEDTTGTGADLLVVAGNLSLTGLVNLELSKIGGAEWEHEDKLTLVSYTGSWNGGLFTYNSTELADDSNFTFDNQEWRINYNDDTKGFNYAGDANGTFVTITAVPEPAAALLGGVGMLFLLRRRRVA